MYRYRKYWAPPELSGVYSRATLAWLYHRGEHSGCVPSPQAGRGQQAGHSRQWESRWGTAGSGTGSGGTGRQGKAGRGTWLQWRPRMLCWEISGPRGWTDVSPQTWQCWLKVASLLAAGYHQPQRPGLAAITALAWMWGDEEHSYKLSSIRTTVKGGWRGYWAVSGTAWIGQANLWNQSPLSRRRGAAGLLLSWNSCRIQRVAPSPHMAEGCSWEKITNPSFFDFPSLQRSPRFLASKQAHFTLPAEQGWNREGNLLAGRCRWCPRQRCGTPAPPGSALTWGSLTVCLWGLSCMPGHFGDPFVHLGK